jgi:hypothetical protein
MIDKTVDVDAALDKLAITMNRIADERNAAYALLRTVLKDYDEREKVRISTLAAIEKLLKL